MNDTFSFLAILILLSLLSSSCKGPTESSQNDKNLVYQTSTIKALLEGSYDGEVTFKELGSRGDFGIGTFNALDGEMVAVDGQFFQVKTDGLSYPVSPDMKTPFSVVTHFEADTSFQLDGSMDFEGLLKQLDSSIATTNLFYAIRLDGDFEGLQTRSVRAQRKPYRPLGEVVEEQSLFSFDQTSGTMVGFRFPEYTSELNVPGYHMHFLTSDRKAGGHVLALKGISATVSIDYISDLHLALPASKDFHKLDLSKDRAEDLEKVEKLRK